MFEEQSGTAKNLACKLDYYKLTEADSASFSLIALKTRFSIALQTRVVAISWPWITEQMSSRAACLPRRLLCLKATLKRELDKRKTIHKYHAGGGRIREE
uniref:Uncharacterized protein n=1 Tax=Romanomermis culicivorax TaxID=13658 RepID=A0A915JG95_ROMCU